MREAVFSRRQSEVEVDTAPSLVYINEKEARGSSLRALLRKVILTKLFRVKEATLAVLPLKTSLLSVRETLEGYRKEGFISVYGEAPTYVDYPPLNFFGLQFAIDSESYVWAWGFTLPYQDKKLALQKAFWEALERHATFYVQGSTTALYPKLTEGDARWLCKQVPQVTDFQKKQFSFLSRENDFGRVMGFRSTSLTGYGSRFLPVEAFYWGKHGFANPIFFQEPNTNGGGGGMSVSQAKVSGIYELIERDLFIATWYSNAKLTKVEVGADLPELYAYLKKATDHFNLEIYFFSLRFDINATTIWCVVIDPVLNLVSCGAKASSCARVSLEGALSEALAVLYSIRSKRETATISQEMIKRVYEAKSLGEVDVDKATRTHFYCNERGVAFLRKKLLGNIVLHTTSGELTKNDLQFSSPEVELRFLINEFKELVKKKGEEYHLYSHVHRSSWLDKADYATVMVFCPALLKLHLEEKFAALVTPRLFEYAKLHGSSVRSEKDLEKMPHPFA